MGGHKPPADATNARLDEIQVSLSRRLDGVSEPAVKSAELVCVTDLAEQLHPRQVGFYKLLALTDVGSRVEYLEQRGDLEVIRRDTCEREEGAVRYYHPRRNIALGHAAGFQSRGYAE